MERRTCFAAQPLSLSGSSPAPSQIFVSPIPVPRVTTAALPGFGDAKSVPVIQERNQPSKPNLPPQCFETTSLHPSAPPPYASSRRYEPPLFHPPAILPPGVIALDESCIFRRCELSPTRLPTPSASRQARSVPQPYTRAARSLRGSSYLLCLFVRPLGTTGPSTLPAAWPPLGRRRGDSACSSCIQPFCPVQVGPDVYIVLSLQQSTSPHSTLGKGEGAGVCCWSP